MKTNSSFPHPVLGINCGILPDLDKEALVLESTSESRDQYIYTFTLTQNDPLISRYIQEGHAQYICEVDCVKTFYKCVIPSNTPQIEVRLDKKAVTGHVDFSFYVVTTKAFFYSNPKFNPDYKDVDTGKLPSFKLETGAVLVVFGSRSDDVNIRFNNTPELKSFIQIVKRQDDEKKVDITLTDETIDIEMPKEMFTEFNDYNQEKTKGLFYPSIILNALVKGILNLDKKDGATWADSIRAIFENTPEKYQGLYLDQPGDAVDIAIAMLTSRTDGSPYDLLFKAINNLQN